MLGESEPLPAPHSGPLIACLDHLAPGGQRFKETLVLMGFNVTLTHVSRHRQIVCARSV